MLWFTNLADNAIERIKVVLPPPPTFTAKPALSGAPRVGKPYSSAFAAVLLGDPHQLRWLGNREVHEYEGGPWRHAFLMVDSSVSVHGGEGWALEEGAAVDGVDAAGHEAACR